MFLVQLKSAGVSCGNATLRTSPSSGQATIYSQPRHPQLLACHSRAAFEGSCRHDEDGLMNHISSDLLLSTERLSEI